MQFTQYFHSTRLRQNRESIKMDWIEYVVSHPTKEFIQEDGRVRRRASIKEAEGRYLRVVLLEDGETIHNAFFDRSFKL